ncbi:IS66 family transposase zinc-finger binding domain-containing protein [Paenibacillus sp. IB182493]|uniref:IS66 family transposase zinc-finger binding domain-containing protein n=1 Tax=Paenibacillus arenilitoris TaxID=2772299 RepID=A0A927CRF4_9BACL|nr:IS66 family transposase zinc-finger binding domain-containing protein [Paenibacillus arenilitoris]
MKQAKNIVPPQAKVMQHVRLVYACLHCERNALQPRS